MKTSNRRKARKLALQAIYHWQLNNEPTNVIEAQYLAEANPKKIELEYFSDIVRGVVKNVATIDQLFVPFLDRKIGDLNPVELAILRLAIYELQYHIEVPYKVVINEALELAKLFGSKEGHKYVNGILDKVAKGLRKNEKPKT
jgi:transcription antitermination protein NusB